jgi:WD40 repeat protein
MAPPPPPPLLFLALLSHDARQCIYERLARRDLRALACVCRELSAEVPAAVAQMLRGRHVFPASAVMRPRETASLSLPSFAHDVAFSRGDGALLAAVCVSGTVQMRDSATGRLLWNVSGHHGTVWRCAFTRDDALLATASADETVKLWRTSDGSLAHTLTGHRRAVYSVACSPAADVLLSGDKDGVVKVWDTATGAELHTLLRHSAPVYAAAFDASGALAATGSLDGGIRLFDAHAGWQPLHTLQAQSITSLQFCPMSSAPLLASGSGDRTAKLWDVSDARQPRLLHTLSGHDLYVETAAFSPDGALLATGSRDTTVKLWRVADGALLHSVAAPSFRVLSVAFHPRDASVLAAGGTDGALKLWQL